MTTYSIIIGVTGTRNGMTDKQKTSFATLVRAYLNLNTKVTLNHGDCFGGDADAHAICRRLGIRSINSYPCDLKNQRAHTDAHQVTDPMPPLERNKIIAEGCDVLIGCPATDHEEQRSGTWATIRHRTKHESNWQMNAAGLIIIWPDGSIGEEY